MFARASAPREHRGAAGTVRLPPPASSQPVLRPGLPLPDPTQDLDGDAARPVECRSFRHTVKSLCILLGMAASVGLFAAFLVHHLGISARPGGGVYFYYAMVAALLYCSLAYQLNRFGTSRRRPRSRLGRPAPAPPRR